MIMVLIGIISFLYVTNGQTEEKGWEKTITLPSGEVVLDMNGEWGGLLEYRGELIELSSHKSLYTITQEGNKFLAVMAIDGEWHAKGDEVIRGELCRDGFKTVEIHRASAGWVPCTAEISENGNKIVLDDGRALTDTLTRR